MKLDRIKQRGFIYDLLAEVMHKPSFLNELKKRYPNYDWDSPETDPKYFCRGTVLESVTEDVEHLNIDATIYYP